MVASVVSKGGGGGKRRSRRKSRPAAMSEINVTPFVDVMLVLLIIFMVAAPLLTAGVPIDMPETAAKALPTEQEEPLSVTLTADGRVLLMETEVVRDDLVARLRAVAAEREGEIVYLRVDSAVPWENTAPIMGALQAGGFSRIGFVTDTGGPLLNGSAPAAGE